MPWPRGADRHKPRFRNAIRPTRERSISTAVDPVAEPASPAPIGARTPWQLFWRRFRSDRIALVSVGFILLLVVVALFAGPLSSLIGHGPNALYQNEMLDDFGLPRGPNGDFLFGADASGRDVLVRMIYGTRVSLKVGLFATLVAVGIGVVLGLLAGYLGGIVDTILSRIAEIILSLPILLFAIGIVTACGASKEGCARGMVKPGVTLVVLISAFFTWPVMYRIVRGVVLSLREREFVDAARSVGAGPFTIMFREILPNLISPVIVYASLMIPQAILFEAYLSFLGLGVPDSIPSWGRMISDGSTIYDVAWWLIVFPGIILLLTVLAFNLLGDGLRDALDPKSDR